jgi:hypothetical protein
VGAGDYEGRVVGNWQVGPPTRTYQLRPPSGKAITHEGSDLRSGERVGIHLLLPPWNRNRQVRAAYLHGAGVVRRLDPHPHVVRVHDLVDEGDLCGAVTEPLPGDNLRRRFKYGAAIPTEAQVVRLLLELAAGLEHVHCHGIVLGNLKPTNVEIFPDGAAKLFALPKPPHEFSSFLDAGDYLGVPVYNSPEMLACEPIDERADIYGLGICGYELIVSGLPNAPEGNLGAWLRGLATRTWPAPADVVGDIHPLLNKVVVRCVQKDRANRYPSVGELLQDLRRIPAGPSPLISSARLLEIVTGTFPAPLAALARALEREDHVLARKDKLLGLANGLVCYLGFLAAQGLGTRLPREYARPTLGHWVSLVRQALREGGPAGGPLDAVRGPGGDGRELFKTLDRAVALRNRMAHAGSAEEGAVLHDWLKEMTECVYALYKRLLPLAGFSTVVVEDLDYQDGRGFVVGLRRLDGVGEDAAVVPVTTARPYTKGWVYAAPADFSTLLPLHPWVVYARCPLCFRRELFFYLSVDDGQAHYVTPDRGHTWSCEAPAELKCGPPA